MRFEDYFLGAQNVFQKDRCPDRCPLKAYNRMPIVGIPLPQWPRKLFGVLVSRDPATAFIPLYLAARECLIDDWRHTLMFADAPPQWLIGQIATFDRKHMGGVHALEIPRLRDIMLEDVYWTHLHKCCTDKKGKEAPPFNYSNAELCGNQWLKRELTDAIALRARFVLCLGSDVERFVSAWDSPEKERIKILYLPHPSGAAVGAWNPKDRVKRERIASTIDELFNIINIV